MADALTESLMNDDACRMICDDDIRSGLYVLWIESSLWDVRIIADMAACIADQYDHLRWIPKSAIGFDPSGNIYLLAWKHAQVIE